MVTLNDHAKHTPGVPYVYSNWCELDSLDGSPLEDNERVRVTWPDGQEETLKIKVLKSSYEVSDMGHPWNVAVHHATVPVYHHGTESFVRLVPVTGIRVTRVRGA